MSNFIPGLELSKLFYIEVVKPIIEAKFPSLDYAAALIGPGSEVLGFDTEMSTDHCWGPRFTLFLGEEDLEQFGQSIDRFLRQELPHSFRSYPTHCSQPDPNDNGTWRLEPLKEGEVNHAIQISTIRKYLMDHIGFDIEEPIETADWLTIPEQKLRTLRSDQVFHDDIGLREVLDRFAWYPRDVWLYMLASGWNRVGQEEHLMGRAGSVGDEVGSAIIASRLVRDLMRLCFLMEKQYAPYPKWLGAAFSKLNCGADLLPIFTEVLAARTWQDREKRLIKAYEYVAEMHDNLEIAERISATVGDFFGRPFKVIHLHGRFAEALCARIADPSIKRLAEKRLIGSIDQISDNTDLLSDVSYRPTLHKLYESATRETPKSSQTTY